MNRFSTNSYEEFMENLMKLNITNEKTLILDLKMLLILFLIDLDMTLDTLLIMIT